MIHFLKLNNSIIPKHHRIEEKLCFLNIFNNHLSITLIDGYCISKKKIKEVYNLYTHKTHAKKKES